MESSNVWKVADQIQVPVGPIIRTRAKKFKEASSGLIHEIWNEVNLCKHIDQGPCQPQRCINLIQILEESTNLVWSRLMKNFGNIPIVGLYKSAFSYLKKGMKIFISEREILSLVLWRTIGILPSCSKTDLSITSSILDCGVFNILRFLLRYKQRLAVISIQIWSKNGLGAVFIDNGVCQYTGEVPIKS